MLSICRFVKCFSSVFQAFAQQPRAAIERFGLLRILNEITDGLILWSAAADFIFFIAEDPVVQIAAIGGFVVSINHMHCLLFCAILISIWSGR